MSDWTHPADMTLRDFQSAGLAVPGTLVEFHDRYEGGTRTSLIGHMNDLLGLRDDCPEDLSAQVVRYRRVWSPDAAPSATREDPLREALNAYRAEVDRAKTKALPEAAMLLAGAALAAAVETILAPKEDR